MVTKRLTRPKEHWWKRLKAYLESYGPEKSSFWAGNQLQRKLNSLWVIILRPFSWYKFPLAVQNQQGNSVPTKSILANLIVIRVPFGIRISPMVERSDYVWACVPVAWTMLSTQLTSVPMHKLEPGMPVNESKIYNKDGRAIFHIRRAFRVPDVYTLIESVPSADITEINAQNAEAVTPLPDQIYVSYQIPFFIKDGSDALALLLHWKIKLFPSFPKRNPFSMQFAFELTPNAFFPRDEKDTHPHPRDTAALTTEKWSYPELQGLKSWEALTYAKILEQRGGSIIQDKRAKKQRDLPALLHPVILVPVPRIKGSRAPKKAVFFALIVNNKHVGFVAKKASDRDPLHPSGWLEVGYKSDMLEVTPQINEAKTSAKPVSYVFKTIYAIGVVTLAILSALTAILLPLYSVLMVFDLNPYSLLTNGLPYVALLYVTSMVLAVSLSYVLFRKGWVDIGVNTVTQANIWGPQETLSLMRVKYWTERKIVALAELTDSLRFGEEQRDIDAIYAYIRDTDNFEWDNADVAEYSHTKVDAIKHMAIGFGVAFIAAMVFVTLARLQPYPWAIVYITFACLEIVLNLSIQFFQVSLAVNILSQEHPQEVVGITRYIPSVARAVYIALAFVILAHMIKLI